MTQVVSAFVALAVVVMWLELDGWVSVIGGVVIVGLMGLVKLMVGFSSGICSSSWTNLAGGLSCAKVLLVALLLVELFAAFGLGLMALLLNIVGLMEFVGVLVEFLGIFCVGS